MTPYIFWDIFKFGKEDKDMPKVVNIGKKLNIQVWSQREIDRIPNVGLGKNSRINTNNVLLNDKRLSEFVNEKTMGALDNYAKHENANIYITPLENDLFDDLVISVYDNNKSSQVASFPMKLQEGKEALPEFLRSLYTKIDKALHPKRQAADEKVVKRTGLQDITDYVKVVAARFNDKRIEQLRNFVEKNQNSNSVFLRTMADVVEFRNYNQLYK